jgi:hypothetical protein
VISVTSALAILISVPVIIPDIEDLPPSPSSFEHESNDRVIALSIKKCFIMVNFIMFDYLKV